MFKGNKLRFILNSIPHYWFESFKGKIAAIRLLCYNFEVKIRKPDNILDKNERIYLCICLKIQEFAQK